MATPLLTMTTLVIILCETTISEVKHGEGMVGIISGGKERRKI